MLRTKKVSKFYNNQFQAQIWEKREGVQNTILKYIPDFAMQTCFLSHSYIFNIKCAIKADTTGTGKIQIQVHISVNRLKKNMHCHAYDRVGGSRYVVNILAQAACPTAQFL